MSAIDAWLDGDDVELEAALADPAARAELVELAMIEVLLPRVSAPVRRPSRALPAIAALVVIAAMIAVLVWPRHPAGDASRVIDTPLGPVTLAPGSHVTVRVSQSPAAVYIRVDAGEATLGSDVVHAGERRELGDRMARRRLGPQVVARVVDLEGATLDATVIPFGIAKRFVVSRTAEIAADVRPGDVVTLTLSPDEHEVFVIATAAR